MIQVSRRGRAIYQDQDVDNMEEVGVEDDVNVEVEGDIDTISAIEENMVDEEFNDIEGDHTLEDDNIHIDDDGDLSVGKIYL